MVTVISQRSKDGAITFAMFREFDRQGSRDRTSFVMADLVQKYIDHATKTKQALEDIRGTWSVNGTALPFPPGGKVRERNERDRNQFDGSRDRSGQRRGRR